MIKKIQLRGISRAPSDRMTEDGGCAESINVQLQDGEIAPMIQPRNITYSIFGSEQAAILQYIHKMPSGIERYIATFADGISLTFKAYKKPSSAGGSSAVTITPATVVLDSWIRWASSIGNTLIVYTDTKPYYFIYKDDGYTFLGNEIPKVDIEVITLNEAAKTLPSTGNVWRQLPNTIGNGDAESWNAALSNSNYDELLENVSSIWDYANIKIQNIRQGGSFVAPFFLRYALRLYDGNYIYTSEPVLCGARSSEDWFYTYVNGIAYKIKLNNIFTVRIKGDMKQGNGQMGIGRWGDYIQSIDIFMSEPIYTPALNAGFAEMEEVTIDSETYLHMVFKGMTSAERNATIRNTILDKGNFFLVKSIELQDADAMAQLSGGFMEIKNSEDIWGENLVTRKELPYSYRDHSQYSPLNGIGTYNGRTALYGAKEKLPTGLPHLNGLAVGISEHGGSPSNYGYAFRYKIVDTISGETHYVIQRDVFGMDALYPGELSSRSSDPDAYRQFFSYDTIPSAYEEIWRPIPYSWLSFPDSRCQEVEVYRYTNGSLVGGKKIPMAAHPTIDAAYAFLGLGVSLHDLFSTSAGDVYTSIGQHDSSDNLSSENRIIVTPNKLFLSEFQNPFVYPANSIITFSDNIISAAMVSVPLSEGQYGQFPLYVFTEGGIRTLAINSEGGISGNVAQPHLARHIAIKGTVLGMEQAVIFTTQRGVMMLVGGDVKCISEVMNGRHRTINDGTTSNAVSTLISGTSYANIVTSATDTYPFMSFMKNAAPLYDYNGERILFIVPGRSYCFVYMMRTGTWHKCTMLPTETLIISNSFPSAWISDDGTDLLYDVSTVLDSDSYITDTGNTVDCVIGTRPFDLGEPDVRKTINHIRIRGKYNHKDVKYILLGSLDCINWKILSTLRGGSYKWFRLVILATLAPTERISWIDVDYETRFTNRLR